MTKICYIWKSRKSSFKSPDTAALLFSHPTFNDLPGFFITLRAIAVPVSTDFLLRFQKNDLILQLYNVTTNSHWLFSAPFNTINNKQFSVTFSYIGPNDYCNGIKTNSNRTRISFKFSIIKHSGSNFWKFH